MDDDERAQREILIAEGYEKALPIYRELFEQAPDDPAISERWLNRQGLGMADHEQYEVTGTGPVPTPGLIGIAANPQLVDGGVLHRFT